MKSFASTASRRRSQLALVQVAGIVGTISALLWLGAVLTRSPKHLDVFRPNRDHPAATSRTDQTQELAAFSNRSLRLPPAPAPVVAASAPAPPKVVKTPDLELVGTMLNPGQEPRAFVRSKASGKLVTVQSGKQIDGATVGEISEGQVILVIQDHQFVLKVGKKPS